MSAELVGFENLPNVFIKEVSVYDYSESEIQIKVSLRMHDMKDKPVWYNTSSVLTQLMQIGIIFSDNLQDIQSLTSGNRSPQDFQKMTKAIPSSQIIGDNYVFDVTFSKIIPRSIQNLNVYCFCFIDKEKITQHLGIRLNESYYGPIKAEKVFESGLISPNTFIFLKPNGEYWSGPVVQDQNGRYLMGSYNEQTQIEALTRIVIKNIKIKDHRKSLKNKEIKSIEVNNICSNLLISHNSKTDINAMFMINIKSLLKSKTNYGKFLKRASPEIVSQILNDFSIKILTIQRQRVKISNQPSNLRSKKEIVEKVFSRKAIVKSYDETNILRNITRFERNGVFDVVESELRSNVDRDTKIKGEIFKEEVSDYKKISKISELFLDYGEEIRTFQFNDYELTDTTPGDYRYVLSIKFVDPFEPLLKGIFSSMKFDISQIKRFVNLVSRKRNIEESGINYQGLVNSYLQKYSYIYQISSREMRALTNKFLNLVAPSTVTLESIKKFESEYMNLKAEYISIVDYDEEKKKTSDRKISIISKDYMTKRISYDVEFKEIVTPSFNQVSVGYFNKNSDSMKVFSKREIEQRGQEEIDKNFTDTPSAADELLDTQVNAGLNNLSTSLFTYFAPTFLKDVGNTIMLNSPSTTPYSAVNNALARNNNRDSSSNNSRNSRNNTNTRRPNSPFSGGPRGRSSGISVKPPEAPAVQTQDTGEQFSNSSDIFGDNSFFIKYDNAYDSYNISEIQTEANTRVEDALSGFQNDREIEKIHQATEKITAEQAYMLPNQLKAAILSQTGYFRGLGTETGKDIFADPAMKNYYELNNLSVKKLMYIDGFMRDKNNNILLNKPVFKELTSQNADSLDRPVVCKLESYTNRTYNIEDNGLNTTDSVFILSDKDITTKGTTQTIQDQPNYNVQNITYEFMNSEIVFQTNNKISVEIK